MDYLDTKVVIPGTRGHGILRYYGTIRGKNGVFAGIELVGPFANTRGKNSGDVDGVRYFDVEIPKTGLFLPFERLKAANPHLSGPESHRNSIGSIPASPSASNNYSIASNGTVRTATTTSSASSKRTSIGSRLSASMKGVLSPSGYANQSTPVQKQRDRRSLSGNSAVSATGDAYTKLQQEMAEKTRILNELRTTVNELQPLLEEYEAELAEKDSKMAKQKADFEKAREEWRESIELMANTHHENEIYYQKQISLIDKKLVEATKAAEDANKTKAANEEEIARLMLQVDDLTMEKIMIEKRVQVQLDGKDIEVRILHEQLASQATNTPIEDSKEKELFELKLKSIHEEMDQLKAENEVTKTQLKEVTANLETKSAELASLETAIEQKDVHLADLETKLAYKESELESVIEKNLVERVKSVNIDEAASPEGEKSSETVELNQQIKSLQDTIKKLQDEKYTIDELKHELSIRPTFNELVDLQTSLDELETLHKKELSSTQDELRKVINENKDLQTKLDQVLTEQVETAKEELAASRNASVLSFAENESGDPDSLPIFKPAESDPSAGKTDWCGLCERDGHSSINCPYENDIF